MLGTRRAVSAVAVLLSAAVVVSLDSGLQTLPRHTKHLCHSLSRRDIWELSLLRSTSRWRNLLSFGFSDQEQSHHEGVDFSALATHPDVGFDHLFVPVSQECHPDCTKRGNCNAEEGRCECPFGYEGPACEDPLLAACQLGPSLEPFFGMLIPRNCECVRQASRFFRCSATNGTCTLSSLSFHDVRCYTFPDKPVSEQWSLMPTLDAVGVEFMTGPIHRPGELRPLTAAEGVVGRDIWNSGYLSLPLERCGETQCHGRGGCVVRVDTFDAESLREAAASDKARCMCYKGFIGHTCGDPMPGLCPNECRERGRCIRGFCHCDPPYWGLDCGRSRAWQLAPGAARVPNRQVLRIYVYELPANIAFPVPLDDNVIDTSEQFYQTHRKFMELLLQDSAVRTENPLEANLFYVPANAYSYSSNTNSPANQLTAAIEYVARHYPYFNASGGRDHFIWITGDRGSCYLPQSLSRLIHITHFGLHANLRDNATTFLLPAPHHHPNYGCYHPRKDVVAAPWYDHVAGNTEIPKLYEKVVADGGEAPERDLLFFFAGSVRPNDKSYSGGARQALAAHLGALLAGGGNYSDVLFLEGFTRDYERLYLRSRFCLAPHGAGFGVRLTLAMSHACVPVIIQDQVYQPYESDGILPYAQFSIRLARADIPHIVPLLRAVTPARLRRLRLGMARYHRAFLWDPSLGGRAYNYTVKALQQRLHGLWGNLWGEAGSRRSRRRLSLAA